MTQEASRFPEQARTVYFWRMCLASRAGQTTLAVQLLQEAVKAGHWYREMELQDEDLSSLQYLPDFQQLAAICRERHRFAQAQATPQLVTFQAEGTPPVGAKEYPLLMALHGNNNTASGSANHWRSIVAQGWLLALPQSSRVGRPDTFVWDDRDWAIREIQGHYAALCQHHPVDRRHIVVAGFSMGGGQVPWLALSQIIPARGFIAVGPYIADAASWSPIIQGCQERRLRGYIVVGDNDMISLQSAQTLAEMLRAEDMPCELEIHPNLGHEFPPDFSSILNHAIEFILQ